MRVKNHYCLFQVLLLLSCFVDLSQCKKPPVTTTIATTTTAGNSNVNKTDIGAVNNNNNNKTSTSTISTTSKKVVEEKVKSTTRKSANPITSSPSPRATKTVKPTTTTTQTTASAAPTSLGPPGSPQLKPRVVALNVMVAGLSGLGKTTMCTSLMESWRKEKSSNHYGLERFEIPLSTTHIDATRLFERYDEATNTILRVRIIDTPGFGNRINYWNSVKPITSYIAKCRNRKFSQEMSPKVSPKDYVDHYVNSNNRYTDDTLVHVCLYLISPGRFLEIDKHFLRHVKKEVTVVPIIAKADTLTDEEIARYRAELTKIFRQEKLDVYNFDKSPTRFAFYRGRRAGELLAIISRNGVYPWGSSSALDPNHSDLRLIRDLLLSEHTERFLELALVKYANYRKRRISRRKLQEGLKYAVLTTLLVAQLASRFHLEIPIFGKSFRVSLSTRVHGIFTKKPKSKEAPATTNTAVEEEESDALTVREDVTEKLVRSKDSRTSDGGGRRILGLFGTPDYRSL